MQRHFTLRRIIKSVFGGNKIFTLGEAGLLWFRPAEYPALLKGVGRVEPRHRREWKALLREGEQIFDVGANIGLTAQRFYALLGGHCRIWAFEPLPRNQELLRLNTRGLGVVSVVGCAVGDRDGVTLEFSDNQDHGALSRLKLLDDVDATKVKEAEFWTRQQTVSVPMVSLDAFITRTPEAEPTFIKLDVEGAAHLVLAGAEKLLATRAPAISCSFHSSTEQAGVLAALRAHGYRGVVVDHGRCFWAPLDAAWGHFVHPRDPRAVYIEERVAPAAVQAAV